MEKNVLITGGASGIGAHLVSAFSSNGYKVIFVDNDLSKGGERICGCQNIRFIPCDLSGTLEVENIFTQLKKEGVSIDVLINNVGMSVFKPMIEMSVDEWDMILNTNLRAAFLCAKGFAMQHEKGSYGRIINIASTRHLMSEPNAEAYAASKGGLVSLTHALASSLQDKYMTVNCISPGWIHTRDEKELSSVDYEMHLSKRVGKPEDISSMCLFLCKEENDFITGQNFYIDGGMTKKMVY